MANTTRLVITAALRDAGVEEALEARPAVVLERIARGGGATRWYMVSGGDQLDSLVSELSPGSTVSFYFDDRVATHPYDDEAVGLILDIVQRHGEAVVGIASSDGLHVEVDFVAGLGDLTEFVGARQPERLLVGAFPDRANDGVNAITVTLPDRDGVTRSHPH
jgi:hypothetical protein